MYVYSDGCVGGLDHDLVLYGIDAMSRLRTMVDKETTVVQQCESMDLKASNFGSTSMHIVGGNWTYVDSHSCCCDRATR